MINDITNVIDKSISNSLYFTKSGDVLKVSNGESYEPYFYDLIHNNPHTKCISPRLKQYNYDGEKTYMLIERLQLSLFDLNVITLNCDILLCIFLKLISNIYLLNSKLNICHGDLKDDNIMLIPSDQKELTVSIDDVSVKILDNSFDIKIIDYDMASLSDSKSTDLTFFCLYCLYRYCDQIDKNSVFYKTLMYVVNSDETSFQIKSVYKRFIKNDKLRKLYGLTTAYNVSIIHNYSGVPYNVLKFISNLL